jgi:hypothetical protein
MPIFIPGVSCTDTVFSANHTHACYELTAAGLDCRHGFIGFLAGELRVWHSKQRSERAGLVKLRIDGHVHGGGLT